VSQLSPDLLIYVLVILGILFFNYLARKAPRQQQDESAGGEPPAQDEPLEEIFTRKRPVPAADPLRGAPPVPAGVGEAQPVAAEVPRRRSAARSLLRGRRNLRRAFVVMTVLGPCRALEPPGTPPGGAAVGTFPGRAAQ
jgi:hypothetical protein